MKTPYLIQRAKIQQHTIGRYSEVMRSDYMGSAEFEFGALPKSLRAMQAAKREGKLTSGVYTNFAPGWGLHMTGVLDLNVDSYLEDLKAIYNRKNKFRLKEGSGFEPRSAHSRDVDFWWDIENHVMWTFDPWVGNNLEEILQRSWDYMDGKSKPPPIVEPVQEPSPERRSSSLDELMDNLAWEATTTSGKAAHEAGQLKQFLLSALNGYAAGLALRPPLSEPQVLWDRDVNKTRDGIKINIENNWKHFFRSLKKRAPKLNLRSA